MRSIRSKKKKEITEIPSEVEAKDIVLAILGKISNLLIQEYSDSLLAVEDQLQLIERSLRLLAEESSRVPDQRKLREIIYDIEDVIDELIIRSRPGKKGDSYVRYALALADLREHFFYVLALLDLIDHYKLRKKLEQLNVDIRDISSFLYCSGSWENSFCLYQLDTGSTIISPVINKFESLATQNQLRPTLRRAARWLRDEFKCLCDFLKTVESRGLTEEGTVWMEELCDVSRSVENSVGLFLETKQNDRGSSIKKLVWDPLNFISQHRLARYMSFIKKKILDISSRRYKAIPVQSPRSFRFPPCGVYGCQSKTIPCSARQLDVISFEEDVDAITAQLLKDDPRCLTISIVGVGGIGKTRLANLIYESQTIADHFPHRFWVSGASREEVIGTILGIKGSDLYFNYEETKKSYEDRLRRMVNAFFMDKKSLIVADASYVEDFWKIMGFAFKDISNGTRIIFTSGYQICAPPVTETNFTYRLHLRSHDESWALFNHILKANIPPKLQTLKARIIRQCGGFPKVIVKLGELLSQRDASLEEWSSALDQLNQDEEPWSEVLKEINKSLPLYLRRCLFYFGLFPAGYKIPARRLIALWVAEGLGRQQIDEKSSEFIAEMCLKELINYDMVQVTEKNINGKIKTCCLPDALRLNWFLKAKEANFLQGHSSSNTCVSRRLALNQNDFVSGNNANSLNSCYKHVVSIMSFDTRSESGAGENIGNFLDKFISRNCFLFLWVLDLENVYKPRLPKAVGRLNRLRYLGLRSTYLGILPEFIDKLLNLQTLDLKRAHVGTLPGTIWKMQKLRHLFLDESFRSMFIPRQEDSSLVELQTLWGLFLDEDSPVRNGLDTLSGITKLGLICKMSGPSRKTAMSSQLNAVANWVQNLKLQSLRLKSFDDSNQPSELYLNSLSGHVDLTSIYLVGKFMNRNLLSELPNNLIELTLSASGLAEDPMQTLDKLPNLRIVILLLGSFTEKKYLCSFGGFPKLEVLKFKKLVQLEEWKVEEGALPSLKDLEIESCTNLKMLPDGLQHVRTLRKLKLTNLPMISSRIKNNQGEDWNKIAHVRCICIQN
ncbi:conserved hypothetical protein [Ricinus communis]|uniref:Uncharacterized protein n=2 Tax=Ricinus communis TaxID=3988 RepID=B9SU15_RICCO|nr:conserved hypothetical protein [Ricinus communis]